MSGTGGQDGKDVSLYLYIRQDPQTGACPDEDAVWRSFTDKTRADFFHEMTAGLPDDVLIEMHFDADMQLREFRYDGSVDVKRAFEDDGMVIAAGASVDAQGQGYMKAAQRHLMRLYRDMGMQDIFIGTEDIGNYAWARQGYVPTKGDWGRLRRHLGKRLDFLEAYPAPKDGPLPAEYTDKLRDILKQDDPKSFWMMVDQRFECYGQPMGKLLTLDWADNGLGTQLPDDFPREEARKMDVADGLEWSGTFDLRDRDSMQRMAAYIGAPEILSRPVNTPAMSTRGR